MENLPLFASKPRLFIHIRLKARSAYECKRGFARSSRPMICLLAKVKKKQKNWICLQGRALRFVT